MSLLADSELIGLLREERFDEFNVRAEEARPDLERANLRMKDLRRANLRRANLRGAYLRDADIRGLDLSDADLDGASLHNARVSGVLFPRDVPPQEIQLSVALGTRLRARRD